MFFVEKINVDNFRVRNYTEPFARVPMLEELQLLIVVGCCWP